MRNEKLVLMHLSKKLSANDHRINSLIDIRQSSLCGEITNVHVSPDGVRRRTVLDACDTFKLLSWFPAASIKEIMQEGSSHFTVISARLS